MNNSAFSQSRDRITRLIDIDDNVENVLLSGIDSLNNSGVLLGEAVSAAIGDFFQFVLVYLFKAREIGGAYGAGVQQRAGTVQ